MLLSVGGNWGFEEVVLKIIECRISLAILPIGLMERDP